jgi:hypothetical protein
MLSTGGGLSSDVKRLRKGAAMRGQATPLLKLALNNPSDPRVDE